MLELEKIIKKCKRNDKKAQKALYKKYAPSFLGICMRYAKDKSEAQDILQDGFVKIFFNINQYKGKGSFEGWMKRIIVNTAISNYHQNQKHYYHDDINTAVDVCNENDNIDCDFTHEELLNVIKELPEGYKIIFNLYVIEGYKHKEIAEMLNIDIGTSKSQFSRAKKIIQNKLTELKKNFSVA